MDTLYDIKAVADVDEVVTVNLAAFNFATPVSLAEDSDYYFNIVLGGSVLTIRDYNKMRLKKTRKEFLRVQDKFTKKFMKK